MNKQYLMRIGSISVLFALIFASTSYPQDSFRERISTRLFDGLRQNPALIEAPQKLKNFSSTSLIDRYPAVTIFPRSPGDDAAVADLLSNPGTGMKWKNSLDLVLDPRLKIPDILATEVKPINSWTLRGIDRHEVQPDVVDDMVLERYKTLPAPQRGPLEALGDIGEKARQKACGDAVRQLRAEPRFQSGISPGDRIDFFQSTCLFPSIPGKAITPLTKEQRGQASMCAVAYQAFRDQCFGTDTSTAQQKVARNVGILVSEQSTGNTVRREIICSGALISNNQILSAQHCLLGIQKSSDGSYRLLFHPLIKTGRQDFYDVATARRAPNRQAQPLAAAITDLEALITLDIANDVVIFGLDSGQMVANIEPVEVRAITTVTRVELAGFQRAVVNLMQLKSRLIGLAVFDDADLLNTGMWREAFQVDSSPTCLLMPLTQQEASRFSFSLQQNFGHTCQSLGTASGAPLFFHDGNGLTLAAVHSSGLTVGGDPSPAIPIETYTPKNVAVIANEDWLLNRIP